MPITSKPLNQLSLNQVLDFYKNPTNLHLVASFYKVFGDPTRIKILSALAVEEMNVCDIACHLDMTKSAISHQLKKLKDNHLVKYRRDGKEKFYSLDDDHVRITLEQGLEHIIEKFNLKG